MGLEAAVACMLERGAARALLCFSRLLQLTRPLLFQAALTPCPANTLPRSAAAAAGHARLASFLACHGVLEVVSAHRPRCDDQPGLAALDAELRAGGAVGPPFVDDNGRSALHKVADAGWVAGTKMLLNAINSQPGTSDAKRAIVDGTDKYPATPLHWAVSGGHEGCAELLLARRHHFRAHILFRLTRHNAGRGRIPLVRPFRLRLRIPHRRLLRCPLPAGAAAAAARGGGGARRVPR